MSKLAMVVTRIKMNMIDAARNSDGLKRRSEEHTSELQSRRNLVCRPLIEKKKEISDSPT